ncbi:hypothetical protein B0H14DRAFT_2736672 [Mycena olivaceomarginata]|nr:hypothetical protein B0H14DRAFT_2736672 [Mycena olivaceomarginata]
MRLSFSSLRSRRPPSPTAKLKVTSLSSRPSATLPDLLETTLLALKEASDAFPPLKSAVGGVVALRDIAERAKHSKSDARDIAEQTIKILAVIASTVPDRSVIPSLLQSRIESLIDLLDEVRSSMEILAHTRGVSRLVHLNRNERTLSSIKARLDDEYRGFLVASALQVEAQQAELVKQQLETAKQQAQLADQQMQLSIQQAYIHEDVRAKTEFNPSNIRTAIDFTVPR